MYSPIFYTSQYNSTVPAYHNSAVPGSIELLEKVVENWRIYEVSKNVVESSRKMLSNPVEKCCRI